MLKLLSRLIDWVSTPADIDPAELDPLLHPELARMSQRELADLPLPPERQASSPTFPSRRSGRR